MSCCIVELCSVILVVNVHIIDALDTMTILAQRRLASQFLLGEALDEGNGGGNAAAIRYFLSRLTEKERVKQAGGH